MDTFFQGWNDLHVEMCSSEMKWNEERKKIYFDHIFPNVGWNDLLRFRRICKETKALADEYIKERGKHLCPEITIYEASNNKEKSMVQFLKLGFPATHIYLKNISGFHMFEKNAKYIAEFLDKHGGRITHVRVYKMHNYPFGMEKKFYEGLPNLESLVVDMYGASGLTADESLRDIVRPEARESSLPITFKNLKKVTFGVVPGAINMNVFVASRAVMDFCKNLEHSGDAFASGMNLNNLEVTNGSLQLAFVLIQDYIEERSISAPNKPNLKFYDFATFNEDEVVKQESHAFISAPYFLKLAQVCMRNSVKLLNVNAGWLQNWNTDICRVTIDELNTIGNLIVSMVNMQGSVGTLEMQSLEKLVIPGTSRSCLLPNDWKRDRKPWAKLKTLDVTVDSKLLYGMVGSVDTRMGQAKCLNPETTTSLIQFFFVGIRRSALTEVILNFEDGVEVDIDTVKAASCVGSCCPNLKKLTLGNWPGTNMSLIKMWGDMKNLEELVLDKCRNIGDLAFVRSDTTDAVSVKLPELKRLSLLGLDQMPIITDILFKEVISQMKLTHLILSSDKPLSNVTPHGIRSLKKGAFADSVEKFPFKSWSLAKQGKEDFARLEKEFRAYRMV